MANRITVKRGTSTDRPTLQVGEFGLDVDTGALWIGSPGGNRQVGTGYNYSGTFAGTMLVGSLFAPVPDWTNILGTKYSGLSDETAFIQGGAALLPNTNGNTELNLFHSPAGTRGQGLVQWMSYSTNANKWINTWAMGNDVAQSQLGTHGVQPGFFIGARSISAALPNDFYDLFYINGYDYFQPAVGTRYRGEIGLGIAPGLIGFAVSAASPSNYREDYGVFAIHRSKNGTGIDTGGKYLSLTHGNTGGAKFEIDYSGRFNWYSESFSKDPFNRDGWGITYQGIDSNASCNDPVFQAGWFQFQAKRPSDSVTSYMTIGAEKVAITVPITIGNTVNTVSPTSPNRTVTIVVNGTTLYLAAKTTNN